MLTVIWLSFVVLSVALLSGNMLGLHYAKCNFAYYRYIQSVNKLNFSS
jgi:putative exporter of polyketide antibiotics